MHAVNYSEVPINIECEVLQIDWNGATVSSSMDWESPLSTAELQKEIAEMIVAVLNLEIVADEIEPAAPLFSEGLGLDSIDALELSLEIGERYGFQIRSDSPDNEKIFASLTALTSAIEQNRTK